MGLEFGKVGEFFAEPGSESGCSAGLKGGCGVVCGEGAEDFAAASDWQAALFDERAKLFHRFGEFDPVIGNYSGHRVAQGRGERGGTAGGDCDGDGAAPEEGWGDEIAGFIFFAVAALDPDSPLLCFCDDRVVDGGGIGGGEDEFAGNSRTNFGATARMDFPPAARMPEAFRAATAPPPTMRTRRWAIFRKMG